MYTMNVRFLIVISANIASICSHACQKKRVVSSVWITELYMSLNIRDKRGKGRADMFGNHHIGIVRLYAERIRSTITFAKANLLEKERRFCGKQFQVFVTFVPSCGQLLARI